MKIDFGCGSNKKEGFLGCDVIKFDGVDYVFDAGKDKFPFEDESVDEAHASHFVEHLDAKERTHFVNELYRVLKKGATVSIITPHWGSCRAYGDPTHKWPPMSEFWFYYLSKEWRLGNPEKGLGANAPHTDISFNPDGYNCDFTCTWGYSMHPEMMVKNQEYQQFAFTFYKEAIQDIIATFTK